MVLDNTANKENRPFLAAARPVEVSTSSNAPIPGKDDATSTSRKNSTGFKLGNFTRSLMAQAQNDNSGLSPSMIEDLLNPMRSQLGLPRLPLAFPQDSPLDSSDSASICQPDKNDSGMESGNSDSKTDEDVQSSALNNLSVSEELSGFKKLNLQESSTDNSSTLIDSRNSRIFMDSRNQDLSLSSSITHPQRNLPAMQHKSHYPLVHSSSSSLLFAPKENHNLQPQPPQIRQNVLHSASVASSHSHSISQQSQNQNSQNPHRVQVQDCQDRNAQEAMEVADQSTELPKIYSNLNYKVKGNYNFTTPSKQISENRNSGAGGGNTFDNGNSEASSGVAAVIPTPRTASKTGYLIGSGNSKSVKKASNTPKHGQSTGHKQKSVPTSKEKKSTSGGWKFQSEHVQGKEYLIIKQLGKGGCGEVLLVIEKDSRELFALKRVNLSGIADASIDECLNEVQMLVELRDSDLVVHIYAWEFDKAEKTMKILMEHGQCDLHHSIKSRSWTSLKLRSVWERLLIIVDFIHKKGIVHADLKPANFIWSGDNLKIIDFGIASRLQQDHTSILMLCPKGTLNFISPETINPDAFGVAKIGPKSDIWSLGCILYLVVYGKTPFDHINHSVQKMNAIVKGLIEFPPVSQRFSDCANELTSVLRQCFILDYRRRPTASDLLQHPYLKLKN